MRLDAVQVGRLFPFKEQLVMGLLQEFKAFAMRGNVIDLAVGVVIGGAFGKIVSSMVNDIVMPPLNLLTAKSGVNFNSLSLKYSHVFGSKVAIVIHCV